MEKNKAADEAQPEICFPAAAYVICLCLFGVWLFYVLFSKLRKRDFDHSGVASRSTAVGGSSSDSTLKKIKYDVFISFRGEDTRPNFTSHLHNALCREKIKAFIDEDDLKKGNEISPTLMKSIEESKLCIVVLSKDYASSRWCLEELVHILRCKKTDGQTEVLPVFYNVDPSDVRKQQGSYAVAFAKLKKRFKDDKLQSWREALMKVADLSGWASKEFRSESKLVDTIVDVVIKKLNDMSVARDDLRGLVGITKGIKEIELLLQIGSSDARVVGIWGVGGIGKTLLARVVYERFFPEFEACSFLENVREESEKHAPDHLKNKLFSKLLELGETPYRVTQFGKDRLRRKKVLVVFDDVDDAQQLEQLFDDSLFGPESRIIITSRDQQVLRNIGVSGIYQVKELNHLEALELFSLHAFKRSSPTANKKELSERVVNYTGGIPLALIVLGRDLYSKSIKEWESTLEKLQKIPDKKIQKVLRISYDSLEDNEKEIFLDIACFFKGENKDLAEEVLNGCDVFATAGIRVLIDKALITVSEDINKIGMHDLIQMMAFEILCPQYTNQDPRKGSRLRTPDDFNHAVKSDIGIETIKGIYLDTSKCNREISLLPTMFSKLHELKLLKISGGKLRLPQGPVAFPEKLRYVYWHAYPLNSLSTNFVGEMLVALDMQGSQLEKLWEGAPNLDKLKFIDLSRSKHLTQVPDLSQAPNITRVNLEFCSRLVEVPSYFQHLNKLKELYLIGCPSLRKLSALPKNLQILKVLNEKPDRQRYQSCKMCGNSQSTWFPYLGFSSKLEMFPNILETMKFIKTLKLDFSAFKELPLSIENLTGLEKLSLIFCQNLQFLPDSIQHLNSLRKLRLVYSQRLHSLPILPSSLSVLDVRWCTSLKMLSSSVPVVKQNWDDLYNTGYYRGEDFNFSGCKMLNQNAHKVLEDEALFRILRFATVLDKYGPGNRKLVPGRCQINWPGRKIPGWFSHKNATSSISIELGYNSSFLGLAFCLILELKGILSIIHDDSLEFWCDSSYVLPNGDSWQQRRVVDFRLSYIYRSCGINECCTTDLSYKYIHNSMNSEHVLVFMDNGFANEGRFNADGITATASFSFGSRRKELATIKKCGVHLLYTHEAERFGFIQQRDLNQGSE